MKVPNTISLARLALALAVSPLVAAASLDSWSLIVEAIPTLQGHAMPINGTIVFSYVVVVTCALPLAGLFALLGWNQLWHYAMAGLVLGIGLMILAYRLAGGGEANQPIDWTRTLMIGFIASITALVFWWLRYGNLRR